MSSYYILCSMLPVSLNGLFWIPLLVSSNVYTLHSVWDIMILCPALKTKTQWCTYIMYTHCDYVIPMFCRVLGYRWNGRGKQLWPLTWMFRRQLIIDHLCLSFLCTMFWYYINLSAFCGSIGHSNNQPMFVGQTQCYWNTTLFSE